MEMKCPKCEFVAKGDDEESTKEQLEQHAEEVHGMSKGSIQSMAGDMKSKVMNVFKK